VNACLERVIVSAAQQRAVSAIVAVFKPSLVVGEGSVAVCTENQRDVNLQ
jgi:hypothetical protein